MKFSIPENELPEFLGQLIDEVDDFLSDQNVVLPKSRSELLADGYVSNGYAENGNRAVIYGTDYDDLCSRLKSVLTAWEKR